MGESDDGVGTFGSLLRSWRRARGLTQERLGHRADLSQRHISFLETGRSRPSRASILALSRALEIPLRERNRLLEAGGFASIYPEGDLSESELDRVRRIFDFVLRAHEPFPAYVIDRLWNLEAQNRAARRSQRLLLGRELEPGGGTNLLKELFDPDGFRPVVVNFGELAHLFLERLRSVLARRPADPALASLIEELEELRECGRPAPSVGSPDDSSPTPSHRLVVPIHLRKDGVELRLASALMSLSTPRSVTLEELRVETFLPVDDETEAFLEAAASEDTGDPAGVEAGGHGG